MTRHHGGDPWIGVSAWTAGAILGSPRIVLSIWIGSWHAWFGGIWLPRFVADWLEPRLDWRNELRIGGKRA